ncbi:M23 family metallopeptidase [Bacillus smithii]|uniref:M23 family metallopeptidase n=1 Tax=Bacillus smithii TaxID=1479 RepID=UPI00065DC65F|nr:M23 family metallopeptidase [Bacillus smithii]AKP47978.1 Stage IV sporulation protein FA SpoIVFA [Bacillus smithii]
MKDRKKEIKKRIAKRNREKRRQANQRAFQPINMAFGEEMEFDHQAIDYEAPNDEYRPFVKKEWFLFKILASGALVLGTAIVFKSQSPVMVDSQKWIRQAMETDIQFASIANWYEKQFGKPLAIWPQKEKTVTVDKPKKDLAVPASGKVVETFQANGKGVMVKTGKGEVVDAMKDGLVIFAGKEAETGNTVVIQHPDQSESWYGQLQSISVEPYQRVQAGEAIGKAKDRADGTSGEFYFAIKQDDHYIDPNKVIKFE